MKNRITLLSLIMIIALSCVVNADTKTLEQIGYGSYYDNGDVASDYGAGIISGASADNIHSSYGAWLHSEEATMSYNADNYNLNVAQAVSSVLVDNYLNYDAGIRGDWTSNGGIGDNTNRIDVAGQGNSSGYTISGVNEATACLVRTDSILLRN